METIGLIFLGALGAVALASIAVALLAARRAPDAVRDEQLRAVQPTEAAARNRVHQTAGSPAWMRP